MEENMETTAPVLYPPKRRWWRDILLGLILFSCGMMLGGVVTTHVITHRVAVFQQEGIVGKHALSRLERALDLTPEQAKKVQKILGRGMHELRAIRAGVRPQVDDTLNRVRTEVLELLNEEQKQKWDTRFKVMKGRWFPPQRDIDLPDR